MRTVVVNIRECSRYDVYCGRGSSCPDGFTGPGADGQFGNPFLLGSHARETSLELFEGWFLRRVEMDSEFRAAVLALRGKVLGCWCFPLPCHATIIAEWIDAN